MSLTLDIPDDVLAALPIPGALKRYLLAESACARKRAR